MTEIVDATVVEEPGTAIEPAGQTPAPSTSLFHTDDPVEVVEKASRIADALKDVIVQKKLFTNVQGKAHVNVEGWQLLGSMLGVTAVVISTEKVDPETWKAHVEARTTDGRVVGAADALCSKREKRGPWKTADDYAVLSMAQTRATAKALKGPLGFVVSLAGYQTTPAEEMTFAVAEEAPAARQSPAASPRPSRAPNSSQAREQQEASVGEIPLPAPAAPPARPNDFPRTGRSDIPTPDVWVEKTMDAIRELGITPKDLKARLADPPIGVKPPRGATVKPVLSRLPEPARFALTDWLNEKAGEALADAVREAFPGAEEVAA